MIGLLKEMTLTGGEWVIYLLVFCSILAVAVMIEKGFLLSREKKEQKLVKDKFKSLLQENVLNPSAESILPYEGSTASILKAGLALWVQGSHAMEEQMVAVLMTERKRLEERMIVLGTLGNNAIYIGLFGTVLGVIKAFHDLAEGAGAGPEVVMQGLSEALIATAVGLLVAIPCVVAYNILQKGIKDLFNETESLSRILLARSKSR